MPKNSIIIKATDYKYPSKEEFKWAYTISPELCNFGFKSENPMISLISGQRSIPEVYRDDQLQYWNGMLLNRNGGLLRTYHNAIVHYQRGVPDDLGEYEHMHFINRMQFDYYLEYFYHQFSTISDTIGQLLNAYYGLGVPVEKLHFNDRFAKGIPDLKVSNLLIGFLQDTALAKEYRNRLTHRTPINYPDSRSVLMVENGRLSYGAARHDAIDSSEIKINLDNTINALAKLLV